MSDWNGKRFVPYQEEGKKSVVCGVYDEKLEQKVIQTPLRKTSFEVAAKLNELVDENNSSSQVKLANQIYFEVIDKNKYDKLY